MTFHLSVAKLTLNSPLLPFTDYAHAYHHLHLHSQFPRGMRGQSSEMHKQCRSSVFGPLELTSSSSSSLLALSADFPCRIHSHSFKVRQLSILKTRQTVEARRVEFTVQFELKFCWRWGRGRGRVALLCGLRFLIRTASRDHLHLID